MSDTIPKSEELNKIFSSYCQLQSESYEFITRTIATHNWIREAYRLFQANPELKAEELYIAWQPVFDRIYEHLFSPFFRPYRVMLFPLGELWKTQVHLAQAGPKPGSPLDSFLSWGQEQARFLEGLTGIFRYYSSLGDNGRGDARNKDIDGVEGLTPLGLLRITVDEEAAKYLAAIEHFLGDLGENQFMFPKNFILNLHKVVSTFPGAYRTAQKYETMFRETWGKSARAFASRIKESPAPVEFQTFFDTFRTVFAADFDRLLKHQDFRDAQSKFLESISEVTVCVRKVMESWLAMFPSLPFVTVHEMDALAKNVHGYKRRMDRLERKVRESALPQPQPAVLEALEQRIRYLEAKLAALAGNGSQRSAQRKSGRKVTNGAEVKV